MASLTATSFTPKIPAIFWGLLLGLVIMAMATITLYPYLVAEAKLAPGTTNLLQQTAAHMSKMLGGMSIGGFPGFEPDDDDKKYQSKVKGSTFKDFEVNYWVKEICNFLEQVHQKNPSLTLDQILRLAGLSATQIKSFLDALREIHGIAAGQEGFGVAKETVTRLTQIMTTLGVIPW